MLAPLEFVLICMPDADGARAMLPTLDLHQRTRSAEMVDLLAITKDAAGVVTLRGFAALPEMPLPAYDSRPADLATLFTAEDVAILDLIRLHGRVTIRRRLFGGTSPHTRAGCGSREWSGADGGYPTPR